jgi:N6-adenosine-specific RNA methylase IME4
MEPCVLFENADKSAVLIDIPRSIEEAQVLAGQSPGRRLISAKALEVPWQSREPKRLQHIDISQSPSVMIDELMTLESVRSAHQEICQSHRGAWCLPRVCSEKEDIQSPEKNSQKRKELASNSNTEQESLGFPPYIPTGSHHLLGSIESLRDTFVKISPKFDIVILDPPWPSRSVRRKKESYETAYGMDEARHLLSDIPVAAHLNRDGLVAVWVTNKPAAIALLQSPGGMFAQWGLEPVGEWIWLKITSSGQPIVDLESKWRKPWERLLIARKKGSSTKLSVERKVIMGVPDLHSRKPNLRRLFDDILPKDYLGLEIFARHLTAGWWSWGDQTLMFQQRHHWVGEDSRAEEIKHSS